MADGFDRYDREEPLPAATWCATRRRFAVAKDGEGPNCPGCLERMAQELAACIDETEETLRSLARW